MTDSTPGASEASTSNGRLGGGSIVGSAERGAFPSGAIEDLVFRPARATDTTAIASIMYGEPSAESVTVLGNVERARALGYALVELGAQGWSQTTIGEIGGHAVVILQIGRDAGTLRFAPGPALKIARIVGASRLVKSLRWLQAVRRVSPGLPCGSYHIAELHTRAVWRNRGLGSAALRHADSAAARRGYSTMSLVTTTVNPARRLYERHGFQVVETRTDDGYERLTGIPGRHLMVKELS